MKIKTFDVDIESEESCLTTIRQLKSIMGTIRAEHRPSMNLRKKAVYDNCMHIFNLKIGSLYADMILDTSPNYYVYTHSEPGKNIAVGKNGKSTFLATIGGTKLPFYVGKGIGNRAYELDRNETHRKIRQRLHRFDSEIHVEILKTGLTEVEALCMESKLIDIFGLIPNGGSLVNLDEGVRHKERQILYASELAEINRLYKNSVKVEV